MTKESGDGKKRALRMTRSVPVIAVICNFFSCMQHLQTLKVEPHY